MAEIIMPKMGDAMTEGKVIRWYKKAGDPVKKGEPLLEIETDKVNLDLEAEEDGTLSELAAQEGAPKASEAKEEPPAKEEEKPPAKEEPKQKEESTKKEEPAQKEEPKQKE